MTSHKLLHFLWWNVQNFVHFDITQTTTARWPKSPEEYREKRRRIEAVLKLLTAQEKPALLAFAEITDQAAYDIRDRLFPDYNVYSLATLGARGKPHIALIYDQSVGLGNEELLTVSNVPESTRPMAILEYRSTKDIIRFYVCHWTARLRENSEKSRVLSSLQLSTSIYRFLNPEERTQEARHVFVVGDLNEEPYGLLETWLFAHRDRERSQLAPHYTDREIQRTYLYNCAWKLLGEKNFYPRPPGVRPVAGSYYWRENRTWHTFDQVIVSGSLLSTEPPYLDEASIQISSGTDAFSDFLPADGLPYRFDWNNGEPEGISDHLPITGRIILEKEIPNV